ncbi:GntR family transcriptional regulator [Marasmitruncus massiliensis]|uniref:GntR family transcriptional regulator n=1 Tax=Marasmitruncus massiliensis TaxID=1944642 RepID=UPI0015E125A9|nr:GntR family transcriptional regulator [Marasmitruncus massiliensis]
MMDKQNGSIADRVFTHLKTKIQDCDYMPGATLHEKQICEELGCGRTPVREALLALRKENLVDIFPRSSIRVKPITGGYINEIYQIRKLLESAVASKFCQLYDKSALMAYDDKFQTVDISDDHTYYTIDTEFHLFLIRVTGNQTLIEFYKSLMQVQYRIGMYASRLHTAVKSDTYPQHHTIIQSILNEDPAEIERVVAAHANRSLVISLKAASLCAVSDDLDKRQMKGAYKNEDSKV